MTPQRRWTRLDELTLRAGFQDGLLLATIAGQLGRTPTAVREKRKRLGLRRCDRHTLSAAAVAQIMGLGCPKTVASWVGRGWLAPLGGQRARPWRFAATALWDLVALPEAVIAWRPERITDSELRAYALEQRAQHPRWLPLCEVAQRYHVTSGTVASWVAHGRFGAEHVQRYGGLWLREDALEGFSLGVKTGVKGPLRSSKHFLLSRRYIVMDSGLEHKSYLHMDLFMLIYS